MWQLIFGPNVPMQATPPEYVGDFFLPRVEQLKPLPISSSLRNKFEELPDADKLSVLPTKTQLKTAWDEVFQLQKQEQILGKFLRPTEDIPKDDLHPPNAGLCAGTRSFWYGHQYIVRARLVTEEGTERKIGFCFNDVAGNNALARLKAAHLERGYDYVTVYKLVPKSNTSAGAGQSCDSIVTRTGIEKLMKWKRYSHPDFSDFIEVLRQTIQWMDTKTNSSLLPNGFCAPWQRLTKQEKTMQSQLELEHRDAQLLIHSTQKMSFAYHAALSSLCSSQEDMSDDSS